jgi:methyl-accepting chemotaxis protein
VSTSGAGETVKPKGAEAEAQRKVATVSTEAMDRFLLAFERSARRWEIVVYPALFAFVLLAAYGFFLIYSLTSDIRDMAQSIDPSMYEHMHVMSENIADLTQAMRQVSRDMQAVAGDVSDMSQKLSTMEPMLVHMSNMDNSMRAMVVSTDQMNRSMAVMTHTVGRPMSLMNKFLP